MSPISSLRLAPTVPAGSWVARKYDPLLLRGNVRFVLIMCVPETSDAIRCVYWTACSEYRLNSKSGMFLTSINVILWSVFQWKITSIFPMYSTFMFRRPPIVIVSRPGGGASNCTVFNYRTSYGTTRRCRQSKHHLYGCPTLL